MIPKNNIKPIFIFSLPRAGSTLLQRILATDPQISMTGEPWILLPFFYAMKDRGVIAEYNHLVMPKGLSAFTEYLPNGKADYYTEVKELAERLYTRASSGKAIYFLDKTPRYHWIAEEIINTFSDAKFIFLWRNPLAVAASCIETWGKGKWITHIFNADLYGGVERLVSAFEKYQDRSFIIKYEDLVTAPDETLTPLFGDYLGLNFNPEILKEFSSLNLKGRMWDPTGIKKYSKVDTGSLDKWKKTMAGPLRKLWCRRYINWIGRDRLQVMGYDLDELNSETERLPSQLSGCGADALRMAHGMFYLRLEKSLFRGHHPLIPKWHRRS